MSQDQQLLQESQIQCVHLNVRVIFPTKFLSKLNEGYEVNIQNIAKKLQNQKANRKKLSKISFSIKSNERQSLIKRASQIGSINIGRLQQKEVFKTKRARQLLYEIQNNIKNRPSSFISNQEKQYNQQPIIDKNYLQPMTLKKNSVDQTYKTRQMLYNINKQKSLSRFKQSRISY